MSEEEQAAQGGKKWLLALFHFGENVAKYLESHLRTVITIILSLLALGTCLFILQRGCIDPKGEVIEVPFKK